MSNLISGDFPVKNYRNLDLGVTGQVVKAYKGQVFDYYFYNQGSANRYIKIYDKATAATASDTPVRTYVLGPSQGANINVNQGMDFQNGISIRATTAIADADTGAPTANDVVVNIGYL